MRISKKDKSLLGKFAIFSAETALNIYSQRSESNPKNKDNKIYLICADINLRTAEVYGIDTSNIRARLDFFETKNYRTLTAY